MADDFVFGVRQCEILNRTIQSLSVSRNRVSELFSWPEVSRQGVYFLFGRDDEGNESVYVGEGYIIDRIKTHLREKEFWKDVVAFVSKDENLNSKYLEARLIAETAKTNRYALENGKSQIIPLLSRSEMAAMEEIIPDMRLILRALGFPALDPLIPAQSKQPPLVSSSVLDGDHDLSLTDREFEFSGPTFMARGQMIDEGFVILKGSTAAPEFKAGNEGYRLFREKLISEGILTRHDTGLIFSRDAATSSSSQAASIVAGGNRNGPGSWRSGGKTINELEAALAAQ